MMPEAMYFFVFWVVVYVTVTQVSKDIAYGAVYLGFALAALSTVKPHGLVSLARFLLSLRVYIFSGETRFAYNGWPAPLLDVRWPLSAGRLVISYLAYGDFTISRLVGKFYRGLLTPRAARYFLAAVTSRDQGHLAYLGVLFWPAIVMGVWPANPAQSRTSASSSALVGLRIFSFVALGHSRLDGNEIHC